MRLLFSTIALDGHVRPTLPLARALRARGHEIAYATAPSWHGHVAAEGFEPLTAGSEHAPVRREHLERVNGVLRALPPLARRPHVFSSLFGLGHAPRKLPELLAVARSWRPDAIVHDSADLAGPPAAAAQGIPVVHHSFGTMVPLLALEQAADAVAPLWRELRLEPAPYAGAFRGLYVDAVPPSLDGDRPLGPSVRLRPAVAADDAAPPWLEELGGPLVYVTLGTVFNESTAFRPLLEALAQVGVPALVTVGRDGEPAALGALPEHVRVERFVPQGHVLPRCAAVVCHAGSGTVLGALAAGVPLVLLPQGADQFETADRCERAGVAVVLWPGEVSASTVAGALRGVLASAGLRSAARAIAAEIEAMPDADEVAGAVEIWVGAR